jgi:4-carboxymuconolactone decarboxylase
VREALAPGRAALVRVAAALATRDRDRVSRALGRAAREADAAGVEEVLLQSHLFVGFPDALEAMALWRELGMQAAPAPAAEEPALWARRGPEVCARVYGASYPKLRRNVQTIHPELDRWMVEGGYGRVMGRPGVDLATRELCIAALLAVWDAPRQLHSHLRGALNAGAAPGEVEAALEIAAEYLDAERGAEVRTLWDRVAASHDRSIGSR